MKKIIALALVFSFLGVFVTNAQEPVKPAAKTGCCSKKADESASTEKVACKKDKAEAPAKKCGKADGKACCKKDKAEASSAKKCGTADGKKSCCKKDKAEASAKKCGTADGKKSCCKKDKTAA